MRNEETAAQVAALERQNEHYRENPRRSPTAAEEEALDDAEAWAW